jgi:hypothetical protein
MSPLFSGSQETGKKQVAIRAGSCLAYSLTLKIEETRSSEMSVDFQQTTQHIL